MCEPCSTGGPTGTMLEITVPDDMHLHVRDGAMLKAVLPHTTRIFDRAIIMPNLVPPVSTVQMAKEYKARIMAAVTGTDSSGQKLGRCTHGLSH